MQKIAITGNIASGKSQIEKMLIKKGYDVIDTDVISHEILERKEVIDKIVKIFGQDILDKKGLVSRKQLGLIVFKNQARRKQLENIVHPLVMDEINKFFDKCKLKKYAFVSIPLLFEAHMEKLFDKIILIYSDENIRIERLKSRNNFTNEEALLRIKSQMSQDEKLALVDYVIYNNSTIDELSIRLSEIIN